MANLTPYGILWDGARGSGYRLELKYTCISTWDIIAQVGQVLAHFWENLKDVQSWCLQRRGLATLTPYDIVWDGARGSGYRLKLKYTSMSTIHISP